MTYYLLIVLFLHGQEQLKPLCFFSKLSDLKISVTFCLYILLVVLRVRATVLSQREPSASGLFEILELGFHGAQSSCVFP
ncbi:hypothetical protein BDR03DRAFT_121568 [Suillus americanus]|nr:hypothetical protein BDR03DRAFT_121568 [Suillus americanus]